MADLLRDSCPGPATLQGLAGCRDCSLCPCDSFLPGESGQLMEAELISPPALGKLLSLIH